MDEQNGTAPPAESSYRTLLRPVHVLRTEKKSRFLAELLPLADEEEAQSALLRVRKEHSAASHHCSAWRLAGPPPIERAHDDGEPAGTAGKPLHSVLVRHDLWNVGVIVTRYFGGVLLGAPGLVRAYGGSAADAVAQAGAEGAIVVHEPHDDYVFAVPYEDWDAVRRALSAPWRTVDAAYGALVTVRLTAPGGERAAVRRLLDSLARGRWRFELTATHWRPRADVPSH